MVFDDKQLSFINKVFFPRTILFGEKGEAIVNSLTAEKGYVFVSKSFFNTHPDNHWVGGRFLKRVVHAGEPTIEEVKIFNEEIKKLQPEFVVAIGGGSILDLAKLSRGDGKVGFIAVPTTLGSGAEVSHHAVFTESGVKKSLSSVNYLPDTVIINPDYLDSLSEEQIILQSFDGLAHALESFVSRMSHPFSDSLALQAIQIFSLSFKNVRSENNIGAEIANLQRASVFAGLAQSSVGVGLVHSFAHVFGPAAGISHAEATFLFLFDVLELNQRHTDKYERIKDFTKSSLNELFDAAKFFHQKIKPRKLVLRENSNLEELVEKVRRDVNTVTNPYLPSSQELFDVVKKYL